MLSSATRHALRRTAAPTVGAVRNINVHEYVAMELLEHHGVTVPKCYAASTPDEAENIFLHNLNHGTLLFGGYLDSMGGVTLTRLFTCDPFSPSLPS